MAPESDSDLHIFILDPNTDSGLEKVPGPKHTHKKKIKKNGNFQYGGNQYGLTNPTMYYYMVHGSYTLFKLLLLIYLNVHRG